MCDLVFVFDIIFFFNLSWNSKNIARHTKDYNKLYLLIFVRFVRVCANCTCLIFGFFLLFFFLSFFLFSFFLSFFSSSSFKHTDNHALNFDASFNLLQFTW